MYWGPSMASSLGKGAQQAVTTPDKIENESYKIRVPVNHEAGEMEAHPPALEVRSCCYGCWS